MFLNQIVNLVDQDLKRGFFNTNVLSAKLPYVTPITVFRQSYSDPLYYPTYFYIGKRLGSVNSVIDLTFGNGLTLGCFLIGVKPPRLVYAFQQASEDFYSPRTAIHNIKHVYKSDLIFNYGDLNSSGLNKNKWDVVLINDEKNYDECLLYLRSAWANLSENGIIIIDYINYHKGVGSPFKDFCRIVNREPYKIKSRHGVGIISKA